VNLHVVGLPHTRFTPEYSWCAYTQKVAKFAKMMTEAGVEVITYGNGEAELPGKYVKLTDVVYEPFFVPDFDSTNPVFSHFNNHFNARATAAIYEQIGAGDIICLIGGTAQQPIATNLTHWPSVEFGIGYTGVFAKYRVWESHVWESHVHGVWHTQGSEYDQVIYNYFDPADFSVGKDRHYLAFMGRITHCKGPDIAIAAAHKMGVPLKIAGHIFDDCEYVRELSGDVEYIGDLTPAERKTFLSKAIAVLCPSRYIEPFCGVHVEAMFSGTPVITSDWGVFPETVTQGEEGFRCRSIDDYAMAIDEISLGSVLEPGELRARAIERYSLEAIAPQYLDYFDRLG
jgi:glycosyltransferase involved in cell wall biosynthesis